ncbi:MAG: glycoside hydrolase family 95 protein [Bacteroidetes bacterium]|nr:glycoside hydrolase family 95 protein [Bacteroidota bacterium]MBT4397867.1 glycoside hydrolase family 95 protein [Bacteroidota bacterium]MBT4411459.1 glycoside hydrolase family 95 protein [Bacteroidota bacterium]MBT5425681.1 glycoside hydrolase family 95 protein [Bacteroidota bacterium]MBT7091793.1 glycoside hydrolase family 95 protein [Bacteroidota bacterium]
MPSAAQELRVDPANVLWYETPAKAWEEALPVGNGRLGAMVFGKNGEERIQLNEETYWSGGPYSTVVKGGAKALPEIQRLIFEGKPIEAHKLFGRNLMGYPVEQMKYQSMANLHLFFENEKEVTEYKRWLDLETATTNVEYKAHGVTYHREVLSSAPDQVIVVRLTADQPGQISFRAELRGVRNMAHSNYGTDYFRMDGVGNDGLMINGRSADYLGVDSKLNYRTQLKAVPEGGTMEVIGSELFVENADAVTLYVVAATNFVAYNDVSGDQVARVKKYMTNIAGKSYAEIRDAGIKDYRSYFERASLQMTNTTNSFLPTDQRMKNFETADDPNLAALAYNFGRYLLISSSRPGTQPANLQGIWNESQNPSWDSKYTTNINTEMNYWPGETGNLSDCVEPLITMVKELTDQGSQVAREHYGADGWVFHQNTDLWRVAAPMDGPTWGTFTVGGAWLTTHLWEHYLYTLDEDYLKEIYPVIKGSVDFFMDFLVDHPNGKWLVTNPSNSPENPPQGPGYKYFYDEVTGMYYFTTICYGASMDMQILTDLFAYYAEASQILGRDEGYANNVLEARARLVPPQIGKDGTLQEWSEDYAQLEKSHRHFSHMYGLYPGNVLSARRTPEFVDGIKAVLEQRGDGGTGFSRGWKMALWARLYDGERSHKVFKGYIKEQAYPQLFAKCFTPLQVDGTFGVTAGITEMIMQSHEGVIELLPALPVKWNTGRFDGVCARGAFELDIQWADGQVTSVEVLSKKGKLCRINAKTKLKVSCDGKRVRTKVAKDGTVEFATEAGKVYSVAQ